MNPAFAKLSILIPTFNEEATIEACVIRVQAAPLPAGLAREIIIVDDGSQDGTWQILQNFAARRPDIRVFKQLQNRGKGAALRAAIAEMTGDLAIFQDADLEYDPHDYAALLAPLLDDRADVVFGSRFIHAQKLTLHTLANRFLTQLSNLLNHTQLTDMETCYKVFTARALRALPLESAGFGIEPEIAAKIARRNFRVQEVPISYRRRSYAEGKKITWIDGLATMWFIFKFRFGPDAARS